MPMLPGNWFLFSSRLLLTNLVNLQSRLINNKMAGVSSSSTSLAEGINRLSKEKSPYLLQHASNPVHWYPWSEEAFKAAKTENKLIFLSVGYSTCHWCHVMEHESFENEETAKIMNKHFINVKVDREERPDVDKVYMTFVTQMSSRGGWPMSVWLTPDLKPVYGGTYFPPDNKYYGNPGFPTILNALAKQWRENKEKCLESGDKILEELKKVTQGSATPEQIAVKDAIARCVNQFNQSYEPEYGGFSGSPKFPQPCNHHFLMTYYFLNQNLEEAQDCKEMVLYTLSMMDRGGIHDHVSQGFARYSTDEKWHVPHFEKMLYDQAQLTMSYLDAFITTGKQKYEDVVRDIITYVMRDLSHPSGGFYSAEDADSLPKHDSEKKKEGAFCCWEYQEIKNLLDMPISEIGDSDLKLYKLFCHHYLVTENGNVDPHKDPHGELKNQNVLMMHETVAETATEFDISEELCSKALKKCREILYEARQKRPRPHLDDKMVTAWNGMMLGSVARAGIILGDKAYIDRAIAAAEFIRNNLWKEGKLIRTAYKGENDSINLGHSINAFADDYAWTIRGLIHLYEATLDEQWLSWADELQQKQNELFWDNDAGGYFMNETDGSILLRLKDDQDGAEPSVNSVSTWNLLQLNTLFDTEDYMNKVQKIFQQFSQRLKRIPIALPEMMTSLLLSEAPVTQVILAGSKDSDEVQEMLKAVHNSIIPRHVILYAGYDKNSLLYTKQPKLLNNFPQEPGATKAYLCDNFTCSLPVTTAEQLKETIQARYATD